jgi:hypothetical protein
MKNCDFRIFGKAVTAVMVAAALFAACENPAGDDKETPPSEAKVSRIIGVPTGGVVGVEIDLSGVKLVPAQEEALDIDWTVKDADGTGVAEIEDGKFTAQKAGNSLKITASIAGAGANGTAYTEDFVLKIVKPSDYTPVSGLQSVPVVSPAGPTIILTGVARPLAATNTAILWSLVDAGATGAELDGTTLKTRTPGVVRVKAVISGGMTISENFEREYNITVYGEDSPGVPGPGFYTYETYVSESELTGLNVAEDFEYDGASDFLTKALAAVEPGGKYLIALDSEDGYLLWPQFIEQADAEVVLLGWDTERIIEGSEGNQPLFTVENGATLVLGGRIRLSPGSGVNARRVKLDGGNLVMLEGAFIGSELLGPSNGGGVEVGDGSTFTMRGGGIQNCAAVNGGGVSTASGGTFDMRGGLITGNSVTGSGGGVYTAEGGVFTMSGGSITENRKGSDLLLALSNVNGDEGIPGEGSSVSGDPEAEGGYIYGLNQVIKISITGPSGTFVDNYSQGGPLTVITDVQKLGDVSDALSWTLPGYEGSNITISDEGIISFGSVGADWASLAAVRAESVATPGIFVEGTPFVPVKNLATKFGLTATDAAGLTAVFNAVSAYIKNNATELGTETSKIKIGDYIDLPALSVEAYSETGTEIAHAISITTNQRITPSATNANNDWGTNGIYFLRILVVGINSFQGSRSYTPEGGTAVSVDNGSVPHVVFHFQNAPGSAKMEATATNANGYHGSAMRKYLVGSAEGGGAYLTGLTAAGVPDAKIWAPKRLIVEKGQGATTLVVVQDKLWFPTVWEITRAGHTNVSAVLENAATQFELEGYERIVAISGLHTNSKYTITATGGLVSNSKYWLASHSQANSTSFMLISFGNSVQASRANDPYSDRIGTAPAFCIYGGE